MNNDRTNFDDPIYVAIAKKEMDNFLKLKTRVQYKLHETKGSAPADILEQFGIALTPLEKRIYNWGRDNWKQLVDLLEQNITEETIRDYMIENKCEDLPIEWVVKLISPTR